MNRNAVSSRAKAMKGLPVTTRGADLAQSLKADLLTGLNAIGHQGDEGGLEVPCPIAPPTISQPEAPSAPPMINQQETTSYDLPHMEAVPENMEAVHGDSSAWGWDASMAPVAPANTWRAPPDCLDLLQRSGQSCVELLQHPAQDCMDHFQSSPPDCMELLHRSPTDCVEVFRAQKQARQIPRQIPPRQQLALSANAPEFVPEGSSVLVPATVPSSVGLQRSLLEDRIPSMLQQVEASQVKAGHVTYASPAPGSKSADPDSMCCPPINRELYVGFCAEMSTEDAQASKPVIKVEDLPDHIPSIGSLNHDSGDCRRCNFFHKGRCQNGKSCSFCHFPHEKRKTKSKEEQQHGAAEEAADVQITRGAPGLDLPGQTTPRRAPVITGPRPTKVSMGTQTEDDLPPCPLCNEPPSAQEMVPPKAKVLKNMIKFWEEHSSPHQGTTQAARSGGC